MHIVLIKNQNDFFQIDHQSVNIIETLFDGVWECVKKHKDKKFYIFVKDLDFLTYPNNWSSIQNYIYVMFIYDESQINTFLSMDILHRYIIFSPLNKKIDITSFYSNLVERIICLGDEKGNKLCDYEWVKNLSKQCEEKQISFHFLSTGNIFKKDGKIYRIPKEKQREQAKKAGLDVKVQWLEQDLFARLSKSKFRSSFSLKTQDKDYIKRLGFNQIKKHAYDFVKNRLADGYIENDGKQTPMKGHPVFIAQHATACCCRVCLKKWHGIQENRELTQQEIDYIVDVLMKWIVIQIE